MEREQTTELYELAKPIVEYLRKKHDPHSTIIITDVYVTLVQEEFGIPFPCED